MILGPKFEQPVPLVYRSYPQAPVNWRNWGQPPPGFTNLPPKHPLLTQMNPYNFAMAPTNASASSVMGNLSAASLTSGNDANTVGAKTPTEAPLVPGAMPGGISPLVFALLGIVVIGWLLR